MLKIIKKIKTIKTMNQKFDKVRQYANNRDEKLMAGDFRPTKLKHLDGSIFNLSYGGYEIYTCDDIQFIILYGEHYHPMIFFADDVESVEGLQIIKE